MRDTEWSPLHARRHLFELHMTWSFSLGCFLCVLLFVVVVSFSFLLVCARSRQLDSFMDYVKVHTSSLLWLFMHINSISGK